MAWTSIEQTGVGNSGYGVYYDHALNDQDKSLIITSDLGAEYVLRPRFIEIMFTTGTNAAARVITMIHSHDDGSGAVAIHTMILDNAAHPLDGETKRIFLSSAARNTSEAEFGAAAALDKQHVHSLMPFMLMAGDTLRFVSVGGHVDETDDMLITIHADILPLKQRGY